MVSTDFETGEITQPISSIEIQVSAINQETGEIDNRITQLSIKKTKFTVPKKYLENNVNTKTECICSTDSRTLFKKEQVINLQQDIILGVNKSSHRLFLIPTLFFFTRFTAIMIIFLELVLHMWSHKKNKSNKNPGLYYRSPLHVITSHFCAICRLEKDLNQLSDICSEHVNKLRLQRLQVARMAGTFS